MLVRTYSGKGAKGLIDVIEKNKTEVEGLLKAINGFVSYYLVRTTRGGFSVSVYEDKAGTDESIRVAGIGSVRMLANSAPPVRPSRKAR